MNLRRSLPLLATFALAVGVTGCGDESSERDRNVDGGLTCAQGGPCDIGDIGPGGGIVFSTLADGGALLEAAPVNGVAPWGCGTSALITTTGEGAGATDSATAAGCNDPAPVTAAKLAESFEYAGATDWYLPSVSELKSLFKHRDKFDCGNDGNCTTVLAEGDYWSSTADATDPSAARYISFADGTENSDERASVYYVRPVRRIEQVLVVPATTTTTSTTTTTTTSTIPTTSTTSTTTSTSTTSTTTSTTTTTTIPATTTTAPVTLRDWKELSIAGGKNFGAEVTTVSAAPNGDLYVTGFFNESYDCGSTTTNLVAAPGSEAAFLCKYNKDGELEWAKSFAAKYIEYGNLIAADGNTGVWLVGRFGGTIDLDPNSGISSHTSLGSRSAFMVRLDSNGRRLWSGVLTGTSGVAHARAVKVAPGGNVTVVGYLEGTIDANPGAGTNSMTAIGEIDGFVVTLDSRGEYVWSYNFGTESSGSDGTWARALAVSQSGEVYVAGHADGDVEFPTTPGVTIVRSMGDAYDGFILKLDRDGKFKWANRIASPRSVYLRGIAVDEPGNIYVTGRAQTSLEIKTQSAPFVDSRPSDNDYDAFAAKFNSDGYFEWSAVIGGRSFDEGYAIDVDSSRGVVVGINYAGPPKNISFGGVVLPSNFVGPTYLSYIDVGLVSLTRYGAWTGFERFGTVGPDLVRSLVLRPNDTVYVGGVFGNDQVRQSSAEDEEGCVYDRIGSCSAWLARHSLERPWPTSPQPLMIAALPSTTTTTSTTTTVPRTTTTTTSTTTTTTTSTTTVAPTTTLGPNDCRITVTPTKLNGSLLTSIAVTACDSMSAVTHHYKLNKDRISWYGTRSSSVVQSYALDDVATLTRMPGFAGVQPNAIALTITLTNGRRLPEVEIPLSKTAPTSVIARYVPPSTSTTRPPSPTTTRPSTTTTVAPTTTLGPNDCRITYDGTYLNLCSPVRSYEYVYFDNTESLSGTLSGSLSMPNSSIRITSTYYPTATRLRISLSFANGAELTEVFVPFGRAGATSVVRFTRPPTPTTTTAPNCRLTITWSALTACKAITSYTYQWWNDTRSLSGQLASSGGPWQTLYFGGMGAAQGTTQVLVTLRFSDGTSIKPIKIPYDQPGSITVYGQY